MKEILKSMLDQLQLLSETINDMVTNVEKLYEFEKVPVKLCECCEAKEELLMTTNMKQLCRPCYEEYGAMFN